jgi:molybdopterin synthase sulfur carrier subunit
MATVFVPSALRGLTGGKTEIEVAGKTVREVIECADREFPGLLAQLIEEDHLRSNLAVAVDGEVSPLGLRERVSPSSEVHFVAAIKGG